MSDIRSAQTIWSRTDAYHESFLLKPDPILDAVRQNCVSNGLPNLAITPSEGRLLNLVAKSIGAKRILEVGTLGGYSTIWFARALPDDGEIVTFEIDEKHAKVAADNIKNAGLSTKVKIVVGPAADSLAAIPTPTTGKYDMAFIDADKESNATYFKECKRLLRPGGTIIVDNVVQGGFISDTNYSDTKVEGVRALLKLLKDDKDVEATTIGTAGDKGYDGFVYARLKD